MRSSQQNLTHPRIASQSQYPERKIGENIFRAPKMQELLKGMVKDKEGMNLRLYFTRQHKSDR